MAFHRTHRYLKGQNLRQNASIVVALIVLFGAWMVWAKEGRVSLYVASQRARFEVQLLPIPVQAPVDGQVTFADARLGRVVERGDVILTLDSKPFELTRREREVALRSGVASLEALQAQLDAEQSAHDAVALLAQKTNSVARARVSLDRKTLEYKQKELEIADRLRDASAISGLDALHASAGTETQRAQLFATAAQAALDTSAGAMNLRDREVRLAIARHAIAQEQAEVEKLRAQIDGLDYDIDRRTVRASVAGSLVDVMSISPGMTITSQERLATILPHGIVRVVAFFAPEESLGRVRKGQPATLRVDNFPWTQFGTVGAIVDEVGHEPRDGSIRVELSVTRPNPAVILEHGLTAQCDVEVDRVTPLTLLMRTLGHWVARPKAPPPVSADHPVARAGAR